jgi:hypothetical protein
MTIKFDMAATTTITGFFRHPATDELKSNNPDEMRFPSTALVEMIRLAYEIHYAENEGEGSQTKTVPAICIRRPSLCNTAGITVGF